jgi:hypothetical protein
MGNLIKFTVKGTQVEFDMSKLTPEIQVKMLTKGCARSFFERETGKGEKTTAESLAKAVAVVMSDPNTYYMAVGHREGVSRPKLDIYERKAGSWFNAEFLPALKLGHEKAKALWVKAGGVSTIFKAKEDADTAAKELAGKNADAKAKLIAAKAKKLKDAGWEPDLG